MSFRNDILSIMDNHSDVLHRCMQDPSFIKSIDLFTQAVLTCYSNNNKILLCGNGGSAADAQHIAAEWQGRFLLDRKPLHAEALHTNSSYITAVGNDYGFDVIYERAVQAQGRKDDILVAISTSGNSTNIVKALHAAKEIGMVTIGMSGNNVNAQMVSLCDIMIHVPSNTTARIQEMHILVGHIVCQLSEELLFNKTHPNVP